MYSQPVQHVLLWICCNDTFGRSGQRRQGFGGFRIVQNAEVGVALAAGVEEVGPDEELDPPSPGGVDFAVCLAGDPLGSVCSCTQ